MIWIRSTSELAYVGHYHAMPNPIPVDAPLARDIVYGVCTILFFVLMSFIAIEVPEAGTSNSIQARIEEECQEHLLNALTQGANGGNRAMPVLRDLLQTMRRNRDRVLSPETRDAVTRLSESSTTRSNGAPDAYKDYLDMLVRHFGHMVPTQARET